MTLDYKSKKCQIPDDAFIYQQKRSGTTIPPLITLLIGSFAEGMLLTQSGKVESLLDSSIYGSDAPLHAPCKAQLAPGFVGDNRNRVAQVQAAIGWLHGNA